MENSVPIVNRVEQSGLMTLNLEDYFPKQEEMAAVDLKDFLFREMILREADFREKVKQNDWEKYRGKYVAVFSSVPAIIPMWAYMIISTRLAAVAKEVVCAGPEQAAEIFLYRHLARLDKETFKNKRVLVKGCGERRIPEAAYVQIAQQLSGVVLSLMYGEACSSVPVYKKPNQKNEV